MKNYRETVDLLTFISFCHNRTDYNSFLEENRSLARRLWRTPPFPDKVLVPVPAKYMVLFETTFGEEFVLRLSQVSEKEQIPRVVGTRRTSVHQNALISVGKYLSKQLCPWTFSHSFVSVISSFFLFFFFFRRNYRNLFNSCGVFCRCMHVLAKLTSAIFPQ